MKCSWLSVLTEKRDAGLQESNEWPCRVVSYVMAQFSSLKTDLWPPSGPAPHPWPQIDAQLPLCAGCHWLLSASVWTPMRGHDSGTETNCHWWATVDISDRFEPSHNRLWCPKPLFPLHFSFLLAVTVSHHSQELRLKTWTRQSEFTLKTVRSSPNSMGWIWNYYPTVSNVKLL